MGLKSLLFVLLIPLTLSITAQAEPEYMSDGVNKELDATITVAPCFTWHRVNGGFLCNRIYTYQKNFVEAQTIRKMAEIIDKNFEEQESKIKNLESLVEQLKQQVDQLSKKP